METKTMLIYVKCLFLTGPSWEFSFAVLFLHRQFIAQISGFAQLMALLAGVLIPFLSLGYSLLYICPIYVLYMSCICPIYVLFMSYIYIERERVENWMETQGFNPGYGSTMWHFPGRAK